MQNIAITILIVALSIGVVTLLAKIFRNKKIDFFLEHNLRRHATIVNILLIALAGLDLAYNFNSSSFSESSSLVIDLGIILGINMLMFPSLRKNKLTGFKA